jgi:hypothetical protein
VETPDGRGRRAPRCAATCRDWFVVGPDRASLGAARLAVEWRFSSNPDAIGPRPKSEFFDSDLEAPAAPERPAHQPEAQAKVKFCLRLRFRLVSSFLPGNRVARKPLCSLRDHLPRPGEILLVGREPPVALVECVRRTGTATASSCASSCARGTGRRGPQHVAASTGHAEEREAPLPLTPECLLPGPGRGGT